MLANRSILATLFLLISTIGGLAQVREAPEPFAPLIPERLTDADPFNIPTGIYFREYEDLIVQDSIPIHFTRTQRNMDPRSRAFGVGGSTSYDMFIIGDVKQFSWVALVFPDGSQARYVRISPGVSYSDGIFEDKTDPSEFLGSRISWIGNWNVRLVDGREYTVQGCGASSKPGQCAVIEIKNAKGERLVIQRDRDGNIMRVTSPHGHFIETKNDPEGRILQARDDSNQWVTYEYDGKGCLVRTVNWHGDRQTFRYDGQGNMVYVHERGPNGRDGKGPYNFVVSNHFDGKNRFSWQVVSTGDRWSVKYYTDPQGRIRHTDVKDNTSLTRYFFDEAGYEDHEEFVSRKLAWTLAYMRQERTKQILDITLSCPTAKKHLPLRFAEVLDKMGEAHKFYVSEVCRSVDVPGSQPTNLKSSRP